jgi:hypothetical protein
LVRPFGLRAVSPKKRVNASSRTRLLNKPRAARHDAPFTAQNSPNTAQNSPNRAARKLREKPEVDLTPLAVNLTRHADFTSAP